MIAIEPRWHDLFAAIVEQMNGQADLLEIIKALRASGGLSSRLDCREQQGNHNSDDADHDQQFH
jgi:hypothetical protein